MEKEEGRLCVPDFMPVSVYHHSTYEYSPLSEHTGLCVQHVHKIVVYSVGTQHGMCCMIRDKSHTVSLFYHFETYLFTAHSVMNVKDFFS